MPRKPRKPPMYFAPIPGTGKLPAIGGFYQTTQLHVRITPQLYKALKVRAAETGVTLQDLVETALRKPLGLPAQRLVTTKGGR
jgi:hypothetical protein